MAHGSRHDRRLETEDWEASFLPALGEQQPDVGPRIPRPTVVVAEHRGDAESGAFEAVAHLGDRHGPEREVEAVADASRARGARRTPARRSVRPRARSCRTDSIERDVGAPPRAPARQTLFVVIFLPGGQVGDEVHPEVAPGRRTRATACQRRRRDPRRSSSDCRMPYGAMTSPNGEGVANGSARMSPRTRPTWRSSCAASDTLPGPGEHRVRAIDARRPRRRRARVAARCVRCRTRARARAARPRAPGAVQKGTSRRPIVRAFSQS